MNGCIKGIGGDRRTISYIAYLYSRLYMTRIGTHTRGGPKGPLGGLKGGGSWKEYGFITCLIHLG